MIYLIVKDIIMNSMVVYVFNVMKELKANVLIYQNNHGDFIQTALVVLYVEHHSMIYFSCMIDIFIAKHIFEIYNREKIFVLKREELNLDAYNNCYTTKLFLQFFACYP